MIRSFTTGIWLLAVTIAGAVSFDSRPTTSTTSTSTSTTIAQPATTSSTSTTSTTSSTSTTTTLPDTPCAEWYSTAIAVGWTPEQWPTLAAIMHRETRCINITDSHPRFNGHDHGLMQINEVWSNETADLFGSWSYISDPRINLAMALEIWRWHEHNRGCGWSPWSITCN